MMKKQSIQNHQHNPTAYPLSNEEIHKMENRIAYVEQMKAKEAKLAEQLTADQITWQQAQTAYLDFMRQMQQQYDALDNPDLSAYVYAWDEA